MKMMFAGAKRSQLLSVYDAWQGHHASRHVLYINIIAIVLAAILLPFDRLIFGQGAERYMSMRILLACTSLFALASLSRVSQIKNDVWRRRALSANMFIPVAIWNVSYISTLTWSQPEQFPVVMGGNYLTIVMSTFFLHRFFREQYAVNFSSMLGFLIFAAFRQDFFFSAMQIVLCHVVAMTAVFYFRREFVSALFDKYLSFSAITSEKIARLLTVTQSNFDDFEVFKPRMRFTTCLVSDWRGYQEIAKKCSEDEIEALFKHYYTTVIERLSETVKDTEYYMDWYADELFIVFYGEAEQRDTIIHDAVKFAVELTSSIFEVVSARGAINIKFDVGIACGVGLVGLVGPNYKKKTTVIGSTPGYANRLEKQAKNLREQLGVPFARPLIAMDTDVAKVAVAHALIQRQSIEKRVSTIKDIVNETYFVCGLPSSSEDPLTVATEIAS